MSALASVGIGRVGATPKCTLQAIAAMRIDHTTNTRAILAEVIALAKAALVDKGTGQAKRDYEDRERCNKAIDALLLAIANPSTVQSLLHADRDTLPPSFIPAVQAELERLSAARDNPVALRAIYRRNEVRR